LRDLAAISRRLRDGSAAIARLMALVDFFVERSAPGRCPARRRSIGAEPVDGNR